MKKVFSYLMSIALVCTAFIMPAAAETWRPENPADFRMWQSEIDGMRFDSDPGDLTVYAIDLNGRIKDVSSCTKAPVSVYRVAYDGELVLCTTMLFSAYEPGVLIPRERETVFDPIEEEQAKGISLLDAEEFILRSDSGTIFDDVDEISFTVRDYFHNLKDLYYELSIPLLREPLLDFPLSNNENIDDLSVCFGYLTSPAFPELFDSFDKTKTLTIDVCLGDEVIKSVTAVPTAFYPQSADLIVRLQDEGGVNLHNLVCYETAGGGDATATHSLYSYRLHVPEGLLLCGTVKNKASTIDNVCCVSIARREMSIDLPAWFSFARRIAQTTHVSILRNAIEKVSSFALSIARLNEASAILQSYKDIGGKETHTTAELIRTLLF